MEKLYDVEWTEDGINRQETGLTYDEAEELAEGKEDARIIER